MSRFLIPEPFSGGIFLSYKCNGMCRHCMYACSPRWKGDWIRRKDLKAVLQQLSLVMNKKYPRGEKRVGINYGLHLTGGEPFINFDLLLDAVKMAHDLDLPSLFVETNCFWCVSDDETREKMRQLQDNGLDGVLVSVNPFILEYIPFHRTERAIKIGGTVFGENLVIYQSSFYHQFKSLNFSSTVSFDEYLQRVGAGFLQYVELLPMGRVPYTLDHLFRKYPVDYFFGKSCRGELEREWHVHVDNYCNYMTGYCGGISLGDARNLDILYTEGVDLEERVIIKALLSDLRDLYELAVKDYGYTTLSGGYISKCHLCLDIRRHLVGETDAFKELQPREFYTLLK